MNLIQPGYIFKFIDFFKLSLTWVFLCFVLFNGLSAPLTDSIYNDNIRTILIYKEGWEMSHPIINLNSDDKLKVLFDDLSNDTKNYYYTLIHCNSAWEDENLSFFDYAEGFESVPITSYSYSANTVVSYINYSFLLPESNCRPVVSGNYIMKVYEENDPEKVVFTRRFFIVENSSSISFSVLRPEIARYMAKYQQFKVSVTPNVRGSNDLRSEVKVLVTQNFNLSNAKNCYQTLLKDDRTILYDDPDSNLFEGGNEFRSFDIKSIKYQSIRIKNISYQNNCYNVYLHPDEWRHRKQYFSDIDINGRFFIENSLGVNKQRDADYVLVHFSLPTAEPQIDGDLYVFGSLFDWQCNSFSRMDYNFDTRAYELHALLKQGFYNYQYIYRSRSSQSVDYSFVEGRHYETENEYQVFVYYYPQGARYERLIGYAVANSLNK